MFNEPSTFENILSKNPCLKKSAEISMIQKSIITNIHPLIFFSKIERYIYKIQTYKWNGKSKAVYLNRSSSRRSSNRRSDQKRAQSIFEISEQNYHQLMHTPFNVEFRLSTKPLSFWATLLNGGRKKLLLNTVSNFGHNINR